jgi:hypothetical protein
LPLTVQLNFRREYGRHPPDVRSTRGWYAKFKETGNVGDRKRTGRPTVSEETVDAVRDAFQRIPRKSTRCASHELRIPQSTVVNIVHKLPRLCAYEVQLAQALGPDDHPPRAASATEMLHRTDEDNDYLTRVGSSDEATFHTSGKLNRHGVRIWGFENPRVVLENEGDRPKVSVWCALMHNKVIGPFFLSECTISAIVYLDMI